MSNPLISAIVLNYRTPRDIVACVEALKKSLQPSVFSLERKEIPSTQDAELKTQDLEILVIDNHSEDESIQWIRNRYRGDPIVRILESGTNRGYAGGNALAISQARGTYLLVINPDNTLKSGALRLMIEAMEKDPTIGIVAPKLIHEDGSVRDSVRRFPSPFDVLIKRSFLQKIFPGALRRYLALDEDPHRQRDVDWAVGACLLMRRDFYGMLGGFDDRYFLFFEDMDLCRRCWKAGKRVVYLPQAQALDRKKRLSEGGVWRLLTKRSGRAHITSAVKYFRKWGPTNRDRVRMRDR
jgi:GT2 family glycosyltransferase